MLLEKNRQNTTANRPFEVFGTNDRRLTCHAPSHAHAEDIFSSAYPGEEILGVQVISIQANLEARFQPGDEVIDRAGGITIVNQSRMLPIEKNGKLIGIRRHYEMTCEPGSWVPEWDLQPAPNQSRAAA